MCKSFRKIACTTLLVVGGQLLSEARCGMQLLPPLWGVAQATHRHCTRPFPLKSGLVTRDYLRIYWDTICPVTMARCTIRSSPLTRGCNKIQLLDLSLDLTTVSFYICVNSQKWVIATTCDAVYQICNAHQFKYNDIIGNLD